MSIQRYSQDYADNEPDINGDIVLYKDHKDCIAQLQEEIKQIEVVSDNKSDRIAELEAKIDSVRLLAIEHDFSSATHGDHNYRILVIQIKKLLESE